MIVELRRYTLRPGRRDELIDLFDRELVESQEAVGMAVLGQFRDLGRPDTFVWLRGFADMDTRLRGLTAFYTGPVWKRHGPAANATMVDSDDVLLLREVVPVPRPDRPTGTPRQAALRATVWYGSRPFDDDFVAWFGTQDVRPLAVLRTEYAANTFRALPVREGEHAFVFFTRSAGQVDVPGHVVGTELLDLSATARSAFR